MRYLYTGVCALLVHLAHGQSVADTVAVGQVLQTPEESSRRVTSHTDSTGLCVETLSWTGADGLVRVTMRQQWFMWLTGFSFMIYGLHVPLVNYATEAALRLWPGQNLAVYLVLPLLIVLTAVALGALLRRTVPGVYSALTGGRGL